MLAIIIHLPKIYESSGTIDKLTFDVCCELYVERNS